MRMPSAGETRPPSRKGGGRAIVEIDRLLGEIAGAEPGSQESLRLHARLAVVGSTEPTERAATLARLLTFEKLPGELPEERILLAHLAQALRYTARDRDRVWEVATRALASGALFDDGRRDPEALHAWTVAMMALLVSDDDRVGRYEHDRALLWAVELGTPQQVALVSAVGCALLWRFGEPLGAIADEAGRALAGLADAPPSPTLPHLRATLTYFAGLVAMETGDLTAYRTVLSAYDDEHGGDRAIAALWLLQLRSREALLGGDPQRALEHAEELGAALDRVGLEMPQMHWRHDAVRALLQLGDRDRATALAEAQMAAARSWESPAEIAEALRMSSWVAPSIEQRVELAGEALAALGASPTAFDRALALLDLGEALRVAGRRAQARERLSEAAGLAAGLGANLLAQRIDDALAANGDRPRRPGTTGLTAAEQRVVDLAVDGLSNREIAQRLFLSPKTVENHLGRVYVKLGIGGRGELAAATADGQLQAR